MKKLLALFISMALSLQFTVAFATDINPNLSVGNITAKTGDVVEVPVILSDCAGFMNISVEIGYDESAFELVEAVNGDVGVAFTVPDNLDANTYSMIWNSTEKIVFEGTLATLKLKVLRSAEGVYPVTVAFYAGKNGTNIDGYHGNYDENMDSLGMTYTDGSITVEKLETSEPDGAYVSVGNVNAKPGESVDVPVVLNDCRGFSNLSLEFGYDASVLTLTGVTTEIEGTTVTRSETLTKNPYTIQWYANENVVFNGTVATLHFTVAENAEYVEYPVTVSYFKGRNGTFVDGYHVNYNVDMETLGLTYISGSVTVKPENHILDADATRTDAGISLEVSAIAPDEMDGVIIAALYNDMQLVKVKVMDEAETTFEEDGDLIKVMWWSSLSELVPYLAPVEVAIPPAESLEV